MSVGADDLGTTNALQDAHLHWCGTAFWACWAGFLPSWLSFLHHRAKATLTHFIGVAAYMIIAFPFRIRIDSDCHTS